jgi:uncharacterized protein (DUF1330 family)
VRVYYLENGMKHYIIIETNIADPAWIPDYIENVTALVESFGGRYLVRTPRVTLLEGKDAAPQYSLIAEFPSRELALSFYNSDAYAPYKAARQQGSESSFLLVPAEGGSF